MRYLGIEVDEDVDAVAGVVGVACIKRIPVAFALDRVRRRLGERRFTPMPPPHEAGIEHALAAILVSPRFHRVHHAIGLGHEGGDDSWNLRGKVKYDNGGSIRLTLSCWAISTILAGAKV